ncbi:MAG: zinc-dependent peptidase [Burkholderiales bacterium]|uniref:M90 family metallopeptidase n=1 Tax=Candidatus Aalborgicola defluviihabitans TaxID=3386187 RepID=UPI001E15F2BB|nr:zinc-dependent peptidase [Burkholderiales bacterium]MBK6568470.1 zinc-dependent peptidase [Burkholderiales bacterium]MBL0244258.1 zinc-dependent peptidase [Rhodoferax sp.]
MAFYLFCGLALLLALGLLGQPYWLDYRRNRVREAAFPAAWRKILRERVPLIRKLPQHLQLQLKKHMQVFIAEKAFLGCDGLRVTDEMRVVIAAQACLLILNRATDYFANVRQILVYPSAFVVNRVTVDSAGVQQEQRQALSGESWSQGQVILSWDDTVHGAAVADDGRNVVIHEFAHQLDQENGAAQGAPPPLLGDTEYDGARWSQVFHAAFAHLQAEASQGVQGVLDHYGAKNPGEFFAVVSEVFFEQPQALAAEYPALYQELQGYYKLDPASW